MALSVVYFWITHCLGRPHYVWDEYLYSVWEKVEVGVIVNVGLTVCVVLLRCVGWWWWKEGRRWNLVPAHSLLFSKSTKGAARLNVPIRWTNRYQQYYMSSQHTYCGRVWNLIQDCVLFYWIINPLVVYFWVCLSLLLPRIPLKNFIFITWILLFCFCGCPKFQPCITTL